MLQVSKNTCIHIYVLRYTDVRGFGFYIQLDFVCLCVCRSALIQRHIAIVRNRYGQRTGCLANEVLVESRVVLV